MVKNALRARSDKDNSQYPRKGKSQPHVASPTASDRKLGDLAVSARTRKHCGVKLSVTHPRSSVCSGSDLCKWLAAAREHLLHAPHGCVSRYFARNARTSLPQIETPSSRLNSM